MLTDNVESFLWRPGLSARPWPLRLGMTVARYVYGVVRELIAGQLTLRAMSLVYTTLLSVVPLLAFSFSVLKGFGVRNRLEDELYTLTEPLGDQGAQITDRVLEMVAGINGGVLGTLSLAFFIYTAIAMVQKVESSFNYVWLVSRPRSLARRVTEYVSILLIGPVAMAVALGLIASISSNTVVEWLASTEPFGTATVVLGKLLPYLLVIGVFTFLYKYLPNARVRLSAAVTGGVAAGIMWATVGAIFASFVAASPTRNAIYSTFAVAISALIWLYLSWLILLIGAQIAFYAQHPLHLRLGRSEPQLSNALRERIALNAMLLIGRAFREPGKTCTTAAIAREIRVPELTLGPVLNDLEAAGLLHGNERDELLPGREMSRITLYDVLAAVRSGGETGLLVPPLWSAAVDETATAIDAAVGGVTAATTLPEFLDRAYPGDTSGSP